MKVLISADMEGTCGVVSWVQVTPPEYGGGGPVSLTEYERARLRMTREVNAAIEGALAGGAEEVIVNDSHDGMKNLIPEELHEQSRYISGNDKLFGMTQGIDTEGIGAMFFTGYHARAGTPAAPLAHTWTDTLHDVRFNGVSTGEYGINAAIAGHFGVPVTLVTGDDKAVAQTQELLGDQVIGAVVKDGITTFAANHLHPSAAVALIRDAAERAVRGADQASPYVLSPGTRVELDYDHQARAEQVTLLPGVERSGDRSVAFTVQDGVELNKMFRAAMKLSGIRLSP